MQDKVILGILMTGARVAQEKGDLDSALRNYSQVIKYYPEESIGYISRAQIYINQEGTWTEKAIPDLNRALSLDPNNAKAGILYLSRGKCYEALGQLDLALADFNNAILREQQLGEADDKKAAYLDRAICCFNMGKWDDSIDDLTTVLSLDPRNVQAFHTRGCCYLHKENFTLAKDDFVDMLAHSTDKETGGLAYLYLAKCYLMQDNMDSALRALEASIVQDPSQAESHILIGECYIVKKDFEQALNAFNKAVELQSEMPEVYFLRSHCHTKLGQKELSISDFHESVRLDAVKSFVWIVRELSKALSVIVEEDSGIPGSTLIYVMLVGLLGQYDMVGTLPQEILCSKQLQENLRQLQAMTVFPEVSDMATKAIYALDHLTKPQ